MKLNFALKTRRIKYIVSSQEVSVSFVFFTGKKIIISSAHPKKKQKLDRRELEKAINIKKHYP
jgi:hypothetical protein